MNYIKLLRLPNVLFMAVIQLLMHYCVITPVLNSYGVEPSMTFFHLLLLIIATCFIAGGGYIINDYFDIRIDQINHPDEQIVGTVLTRKQTMTFYQVMTAIGIFAGIWLCYYARSLTYIFIFLVIVGLLWFYSASYKRQLVIGNLIISLLAGIVPFIVALFEVRFLSLEYLVSDELIFLNSQIMYWMAGFALFAFLWTFIREVIKDMEDEKGDREMECHTFPVVLGKAKTKWLLYGLILIALLAGGYLVLKVIPIESSLSWRYYLSGIIVPAILLVYFIYRADNNSDYKLSALLAKIIMLIGTLYSLLICYLL
jgi:4-hydroxybenzoate polyprenyltransferase